MSLMDFAPISDQELLNELLELYKETADEAYRNDSYNLAFKAHVLWTAYRRLEERVPE